jgi:hypothetical protein
MRKGDLTTTPIAPLLLDLAATAATGCLRIADSDGDEAELFLRSGMVYAITVPGMRPQLGAKLVSSGALAPEALAHALEAQRTELQGWRLGELLVHMGYVDQPVVEAFVKEQIHDALWELIRWTRGPWSFRENVKTREEVAPPVTVADLLHELRARGFEWEAISQVVHGPGAVPVLSARGSGEPQTTLDNDAWSMLCKVDGQRSVADLARDGGYTLFEAGQVIVALVQAGLVDIEEDVDLAGSEPYGASTIAAALAGEADADSADRPDDQVDDGTASAPMSQLARLVAGLAGDGDALTEAAELDAQVARAATADAPPVERPAARDEPADYRLRQHSDESFAASIARVSTALCDVLGPATDVDSDAASGASDLRAKRARARARTAVPDPEWERQERHRAAAAAELAAAHALAESSRLHDEISVSDEQAVRVDEATEAAAWAEHETRQQSAREEADRIEAEGHAAEAAERRAAEAARLAAEETARLAAQEAERQAEGERAEAQRVAEEHAARLAAEEAERLAAEEAERLAAEEAARLAAQESERQAEAERVETERLEAEQLEAERVETERLEAERVEAERLADEHAARVADEEAERLAAEEAERQAEAERLETERLEAERLEAERVEAQRLADEHAARLAAEEAERQAEAERIDTERVEAERHAAAEAARLEVRRLAQAQAALLHEERQAAAVQLEAERLDAEQLDEEQAADGRADEDSAGWAAASYDDQRAAQQAASALLMELSAATPEESNRPRVTVDINTPATVAEPEPSREDVEDGAEPSAPMEQWAFTADDAPDRADTAALLRELSSLGVEDDPLTPPATPAPRGPGRPPPAPDKKQRKKIGLFGL